jgi:hypothetical protein
VKRVVVLQSNYLPWRGYFALMALADEFVVYDTCQYTVNDWRNRNQVKTAQGLVWLTVPVLTKGRTGQRIVDAELSDRAWMVKHRRTVEQAVGRAPHAAGLVELLAGAYDELGDATHLHDVNVHLLTRLRDALGIDTPITLDADYGELDGDPSERVAELVTRAGGTSYLTGPRGLDYLEPGRFAARGIDLEVVDYGRMSPYPQLHGDFVGTVSVLDLLANCGPSSRRFLDPAVRAVEDVGGARRPAGPEPLRAPMRST